MTAETQPFKAAYPACSPEPRWTRRESIHTCAQTCTHPQTQQPIHKYTNCCLIAQGEEPLSLPPRSPVSDASAAAESQSSLTADDCFTPVMNTARLPFLTYLLFAFISTSPVRGQSHETRVSRMAQSSLGKKSNARLRPSSESKGLPVLQMCQCCASDKVREAIFLITRISQITFCFTLNSYLPVKRRKTPCSSSSALLLFNWGSQESHKTPCVGQL